MPQLLELSHILEPILEPDFIVADFETGDRRSLRVLKNSRLIYVSIGRPPFWELTSADRLKIS